MVAIPLKHEIPGQNKVIPGQALKIGQIPGLSRASLDGWQLCKFNSYSRTNLANLLNGVTVRISVFRCLAFHPKNFFSF